MIIEICGYEIQVDESDYQVIMSHKWYVNHYCRKVSKKIYFMTNKKDQNGQFRSEQLHRIIMNSKKGDGKIVDHVNGDTLDNRKSNLRVCTVKENTRNQKLRKTNTSGYKGVSWCKDRKKWQVSIMTNDGQLFLGRFDDITDAHTAYCEASKKYHGEFGRTE